MVFVSNLNQNTRFQSFVILVTLRLGHSGLIDLCLLLPEAEAKRKVGIPIENGLSLIKKNH